MARPDVETAYFSAKLWYWMLHGMAYGIIGLYDNPLRTEFFNFNLAYILPIVILDTGASYLLHTVRRNPGLLKDYNKSRGIEVRSLSRMSEKTNVVDEKRVSVSSNRLLTGNDRRDYDPPRIDRDGSLELSNDKENGREMGVIKKEQDLFETIERRTIENDKRLEIERDQGSRTNIHEVENHMLHISQEEEKKEESLDANEIQRNAQGHQPFGHFSLELEENKQELRNPKKHFCLTCQLEQPFRARHCELCEECFCKFDHHCFWIGGCVAEKNHGRFWLMLFCMSVLYTWGFLIAWEALNSRRDNTKTTEYGAFFVLACITFAGGLFAHILFWYHSYLLLTGQTTWEQARGKTISYLKPYPIGFRPFHYGIFKNLWIVAFYKDFYEWEMPDVQEVWKEMPFNWCENQYWSCC